MAEFAPEPAVALVVPFRTYAGQYVAHVPEHVLCPFESGVYRYSVRPLALTSTIPYLLLFARLTVPAVRVVEVAAIAAPAPIAATATRGNIQRTIVFPILAPLLCFGTCTEIY
jgi:hypothetical protein